MNFESEYDQIVSTLDILNCGLVARDMAGVILRVNERLAKWLGYTREEMIGRSADNFVPKEVRDVFWDELKAVEEGDLRARLSILQRKDGTTMPVLIVPQVLRDGLGQQVGGAGVVVDLGAIQTAKPVGYGPSGSMRETLTQISSQIQALSLVADSSGAGSHLLRRKEFGELSEREREVLALLLEGERVPAIAQNLHISPHTVRNHLKSMYRKVGVGSQSELIHWARSPEDRDED